MSSELAPREDLARLGSLIEFRLQARLGKIPHQLRFERYGLVFGEDDDTIRLILTIGGYPYQWLITEACIAHAISLGAIADSLINHRWFARLPPDIPILDREGLAMANEVTPWKS